MKNEEDLNRINNEINTMKTVPYFVSIVLFVLAVYSVLFAVMPEIILVRILPAFADTIRNASTFNRIFFFLGLAYIFFGVGLVFYIGWKKFRKFFE